MTEAATVKTKILVISLESATERRAKFAARAADAGVAWDFFPAYTQLHPSLRYVEADAIALKGRPMRKGELGCYSSHYALWEKLVQDDADQYVVMEDDIIVDWEFIRKVSQTDLDGLGVGYLRLYCQMLVNNTAVMRSFIDQSRSIIQLFGFACGTQAYLITKATARKMMDCSRNVRSPIDNVLDRSWSHGVPNLSVFPFPVMEESVPSGIGMDRYDKVAVPPLLKLRSFIYRKMTRWQIRGQRLSHTIKRMLGHARVVNYMTLRGTNLAQMNKSK